ncbi:hypothetical protein SteCoe_27908 [Stentor coeruleus]|uniref:Uncharacterized protein n=1 Tax=Stentor coeruleus TaxID=5963 RepID=A0A1R2B9Y2_9CILI|nr:hypothetical protein SteCoe_27908 [Stentor coeruleus]
MWKDSVEVKVIRLEGFPCSSTELALYLYADDTLHDQLLPITEEKSLYLPYDAVYKLEIINQSTQEVKTVRFKRDLFKNDGVRWLPLFTQSNDYLTELLEDVQMPRILMIFYRKKRLSTIEEHSSTEEAQEIQDVKVSPLDIEGEKNNPDEKIGIEYKNALEFERKIRDEQEKNMKKLEKELKDALERNKKREDSLLQLVNVKEEELMAAQKEISNLRGKIVRLEYENTQLHDLLESYKSEKECLNYEGLRNELEVFTHYFHDNEEISKLKSKLKNYESRDQSLHEQELLLLEAIKGKPVDIKKENELVYSISGKKISLLILNGCLMFRTLSSLEKFDNFFLLKKERSMTPTSKPHKRAVSDLKTQESDSKAISPKRINTSFTLKKPAFKP